MDLARTKLLPFISFLQSVPHYTAPVLFHCRYNFQNRMTILINLFFQKWCWTVWNCRFVRYSAKIDTYDRNDRHVSHSEGINEVKS